MVQNIPVYYNVCTDTSIENEKKEKEEQEENKEEKEGEKDKRRKGSRRQTTQMRVIFRRLLLYISIPKLLKAPNQGWSLLYLIRKSILSSSKVRKFNGDHRDVSEINRT